MANRKSTKGQIPTHKTLYIKQKIAKHQPHCKPDVNSDVLEW
jgi:hypothetical protein